MIELLGYVLKQAVGASLSILQARGYRNFTEVEGGFKAIAETGLAKTEEVQTAGMWKS